MPKRQVEHPLQKDIRVAIVEEISDEELDCVSDFLDNYHFQRLTESEYINVEGDEE